MEDRSRYPAEILSGPQVLVMPNWTRVVAVVARVTVGKGTYIDCVVISATADRIPDVGEKTEVVYYQDFFSAQPGGANKEGWFSWRP